MKFSEAKTVKGDIVVSARADRMINNAKIIMADMLASNGVIHVIDSVLRRRAIRNGLGRLVRRVGPTPLHAVLNKTGRARYSRMAGAADL